MTTPTTERPVDLDRLVAIVAKDPWCVYDFRCVVESLAALISTARRVEELERDLSAQETDNDAFRQAARERIARTMADSAAEFCHTNPHEGLAEWLESGLGARDILLDLEGGE